MTTIFLKRRIALLTGLFLICALLSVGAAGQGRGKRKSKGRGILPPSTATGDYPTLTSTYICQFTLGGNYGVSLVTMSYTGNRPNNGFVGVIQSVVNNRTIIEKNMQVYDPRPPEAGMGDGKLWSFQHQDGSVVCKDMYVSKDKRIVRFSQCSNGAIQFCQQ